MNFLPTKYPAVSAVSTGFRNHSPNFSFIFLAIIKFIKSKIIIFRTKLISSVAMYISIVLALILTICV